MNDLIKMLLNEISETDLVKADKLSEISMAITKERIGRNMSQREFAEFMGVSQGMVSKWENGDYNFTIEKLIEIAAKLDMNLELNLISKPKPLQTFTTNNNIIYICAAVSHGAFWNDTQSSICSFDNSETKEM